MILSPIRYLSIMATGIDATASKYQGKTLYGNDCFRQCTFSHVSAVRLDTDTRLPVQRQGKSAGAPPERQRRNRSVLTTLRTGDLLTLRETRLHCTESCNAG